MNPIYFSIAVLATLSVLTVPLAQATESTQIDASLIGNSAIDVNGEVGERLVRAYAQFANFDISEKYFNVDVIQLETGNVVSSSQVNVYSTSTGLIDFGSLVGYLVNDRDICSYDMSNAQEGSVCTDVMTGNYQIEISTRNGIMAEPVQFSILA
ncbi:MAG: hypothetical protein IH792_03880 [Thaumarchaeota archaeon]|nr:hypothetical protein [Nitrososphaerota archaeon]